MSPPASLRMGRRCFTDAGSTLPAMLLGLTRNGGCTRGTLSHRLQRIEALSGCSFTDPHDRLNISIALLIGRLSSPRSPA